MNETEQLDRECEAMIDTRARMEHDIDRLKSNPSDARPPSSTSQIARKKTSGMPDNSWGTSRDEAIELD